VSNTNPTKTRGWTRVFRKGRKLELYKAMLLLRWGYPSIHVTPFVFNISVLYLSKVAWSNACYWYSKVYFLPWPLLWNHQCRKITGLVARLTQLVSLVEQELPTLPEHLSFSGVRVTRSLVLAIVLSVLLWYTDCDYPMVSSNSSFTTNVKTSFSNRQLSFLQ
jgi:hypothetical protein